jgi:ABC-2 type transport system permease protein
MSSNAFASLTAANSRELVRDRKTATANLLLPVFFLGLFVAISLLIDPGGERGIMRFSLPTATFFVLGSISFFGTVVPAVELRRRGTLRLLSTTPLKPSTFLLALAPIRLAIALVFLAVAIAISQWFGLLQVERVPLIVAAFLGGLAFFVSLGFVLAARLDSAEAANNILTLVLILLLFLAGGLTSLDRLPDGVRVVMEWLPPSMMLDALRHAMAGADAHNPSWLSLLVLLGASVAMTLLAVRLFRWDRGGDG